LQKAALSQNWRVQLSCGRGYRLWYRR